jgi:hypothetical protein
MNRSGSPCLENENGSMWPYRVEAAAVITRQDWSDDARVGHVYRIGPQSRPCDN